MTHEIADTEQARYARAIATSKKVRWDIDADVIRGRRFERTDKLLPDGLSLAHKLEFLTSDEQRLLSQIEGRTYANMFGLVERFINTKVLELSQRHAAGDQVALEALVRFSDEELKHQELFRRIEVLIADTMPEGYRFVLDANEVATAVLAQPHWSVLALTCLIELFSQAHYKVSIAPDAQLSPLFRDVFRLHWLEESQHAVIDELEWRAEDRRLSAAEREQGVTGLITLVGAVDGLVRVQAGADAECLLKLLGRELSAPERERVRAGVLEAYRYQYVFSGVQMTSFPETLRRMIGDQQFARVEHALAGLG